MSETTAVRPSQPSPSDSLLHSDLLFRVLGGDAMQMLRCGICMEFFDVPIVLPCGHTFCLQCLTEMCKHASQTCVLTPLKDLRISCPNCRVLIYASPILERNVTCNFIIQSLVECLKGKHGGTPLSIGTNTEEVRVGSKIRTVSDFELERVMKEIDRMTECLGKRSVLDNAFFEVDEIRRQHWVERARRQEEQEEQERQKARNHNRNTKLLTSQLRLHQQQEQQQQPQHQQPFFQQPQPPSQQQQRSNTFGWEVFNVNKQSKPMTPVTPSITFQVANAQQQYAVQQSQPMPQQQQTSVIPTQINPTTSQQHHQQKQPQHHQHQPSQLQPNQSRVSKMATVLPLQRCPDLSQHSGNMTQFEPPSGHSYRLDNDPAVMSYSYKAAVPPMPHNK